MRPFFRTLLCFLHSMAEVFCKNVLAISQLALLAWRRAVAQLSSRTFDSTTNFSK